MTLNAFGRDIDIRGTKWQFVGDVHEGNERTVWIRAGYQDHEGAWTRFPPVEADTRDGQTLEERFNEFVDRFSGQAEETV